MNWDAVFREHGWFYETAWDESPDTFGTVEGFEAAGWEVN